MFCPLINSPCIEHSCRFHSGKDGIRIPTDGDTLLFTGCTLTEIVAQKLARYLQGKE